MTPLDIARSFLKAIEQTDDDTGATVLAPDCEYANLPLGTVRGPACAPRPSPSSPRSSKMTSARSASAPKGRSRASSASSATARPPAGGR